MRRFSCILVPAVGLILAGCSLLSPKPDPMPSPLVVNPAALRIALLTPAEIQVPKSGIVLSVYQSSVGGATIARKYDLVATSSTEEGAMLSGQVKSGQVVHVLRLLPGDALDLRDQQSDMEDVRASGATVQPGFSVGLEKLCWKGPLTATGVPIDVLISGDETGRYRTLLSGIDATSLVNQTGGGGIRTCS